MNTPRTDAARWRLVCHFDQGGEYDANPKRANDGEWVPVETCEQLENELAAMTALADRLANTLWKVGNCRIFYEESLDIDNYTTDEVKEALAVYEKHKKQTP